MKFKLVKNINLDESAYQIAYNLDYFNNINRNENTLIGFNTIPNFYRGNKLEKLNDLKKKLIQDLFYLTHHTDFANSRLCLDIDKINEFNKNSKNKFLNITFSIDFNKNYFMFFNDLDLMFEKILLYNSYNKAPMFIVSKEIN